MQENFLSMLLLTIKTSAFKYSNNKFETGKIPVICSINPDKA